VEQLLLLHVAFNLTQYVGFILPIQKNSLVFHFYFVDPSYFGERHFMNLKNLKFFNLLEDQDNRIQHKLNNIMLLVLY
jgi:hypothetical protein